MQTWYEREEDNLVEQYNSGMITQAEYNKQMRELQREYAAQAREAAEDAYDNEMQRW